ncbi:MAG: hypothetical protein ABJB01_02300 [Rudaea sp.]
MNSSELPRRHYLVAALLLWVLAAIYFFANTGHVELHVTLNVDDDDVVQTFYSRNAQWNENESIKTAVAKGRNDVVVSIPALLIGDFVRFDPGQKRGSFRLSNAYWLAGTSHVPIVYQSIINSHPMASDLSSSDNESIVVARDNDPQLGIPTPPLFYRAAKLLKTGALLFVTFALLLAAVARRVSLRSIAAATIAVCGILYFYTCASIGPRLPLFDDWRYLLPGQFNLIDGWGWLRAVGNDTYFLTNQVFDFLVLKITNVDFFALRLAAVGLLLLQLGLQIRLIFLTTNSRPLIGAIAIASCIASLSAGAYWSNATIAYQQALPTLFGTVLLYLLARGEPKRLHPGIVATILVCSLASGLAYISGGVLLASLGFAGLVVYMGRSRTLAAESLIVLIGGLALFILQFALVSIQQGSLLEHSHRAETVFPNDRRFWVFFFALFGRALGYGGLHLPIDVLCALVVLAPAAILAFPRIRSDRDESPQEVWSLFAIYAGVGSATYAAIVAFGRGGFAPADADVTLFTSMGKNRFHFWPIAAMIPYAWLGWAACFDRWSRRYAQIAGIAAALLLVTPKSLSLLDNASRQRAVADIEREGARCVARHIADANAARPVICVALTVGLNDIGPTLMRLRDRNATVYRQLIDEGYSADNTVTH